MTGKPLEFGQEMLMIEGTLIAESLRPGTNLENLGLAVRAVRRFQVTGVGADQPETWAQAHGRRLAIPEAQLDWPV